MLILSRKPGEEIVIGDDIVIKYLGRLGETIRIGIATPKEKRVFRTEIEDPERVQSIYEKSGYKSKKDIEESIGNRKDYDNVNNWERIERS